MQALSCPQQGTAVAKFPGRTGVLIQPGFCTRTGRWVARAETTDQSGSSGWSTRELFLLREMVASRQQVDRLLEQQHLLINMVAASHPGLAHMQLGLSRAPEALVQTQQPQQFALAQRPEAVSPSAESKNSMAAVPKAGSDTVPDGSAVMQLLGDMGAVRTSPAQQDSAIQAALRLVTEGDVLTDMPLPPASERTAPPPVQAPAPAPAPVQMSLPTLTPGTRSSWWMEKLHVALLARGYYSGDEDVQSWTFGEGTRSAIIKFQKDQSLPATGVTDPATWSGLLAELPELRQDMEKEYTAQADPSSPQAPAQQTPAPQPARPQQPPSRPQAQAPPPVQQPSRPAPPTSNPSPGEDHASKTRSYYSSGEAMTGSLPFNPSFSPFEGEEPMPLDPLEAYYASAGTEDNRSDRAGGSKPPKTAVNRRPPSMVQGDVGGFFMETLHAALLRAGFDPSFREIDREEFGDNTLSAVTGFQSSQQLPSTGVVDDATWALLLKGEADLRSAFISTVALGSAAPPPAPAPTTTAPTASNGNGLGRTAIGEAGSKFNGSGNAQNSTQASQTSSSSTAAASTAAAGKAPEATSSVPDSGQVQPLTVPKGTLPALSAGADDILWVSRLHRALISNAFHPSEEECEEWLFNEGTLEAVLAAQASAGLQEIGVVCPATWQWLLRAADHPVRAEIEAAVGSWSTWGQSTSTLDSKPPEARVETPAAPSPQQKTPATPKPPGADRSQWPVIMEGDGGNAVGLMQRALGAAGYACGDDEPRWWQWGSDTTNALRTFQACSDLPETGVCDQATWQALLRTVGAPITTLEELMEHFQSSTDGDEEPFDDLGGAQQEGRVWLLGEQRWEQRGKGK